MLLFFRATAAAAADGEDMQFITNGGRRSSRQEEAQTGCTCGSVLFKIEVWSGFGRVRGSKVRLVAGKADDSR